MAVLPCSHTFCEELPESVAIAHTEGQEVRSVLSQRSSGTLEEDCGLSCTLTVSR